MKHNIHSQPITLSSKLVAIRIILLLSFLLWVGFPARSVQADSAGRALDFDGVNDYVRLVRTNTLMGGNSAWATSKTISLWLKPETATSPTVQPEVGQLIVGNDSPRSFGLTRATSGGNDRLWAWNVDSNGIDRIAIPFTPGEWVHIAIVHDGTTLTVYKNGTQAGSTASGATTIFGSTGDGTLFLGGSGRSGTTSYFRGQLDEIRFWNSVLDQSAIAEWMTTEVTDAHPNYGNLAADYRMSNGSGTVLSDDSGHGHNGSLRGGMSETNWVVSTAYGPVEPPEPNEPPVAGVQSVSVEEDSSVDILLTGTDADNHPLSFRVVGQPSQGALSGTAPTLRYTPAENVFGADSFTFVVNDGFVDSAAAEVSISVMPVNDAPVAVADEATTEMDAPVTVQALANDSDVDGDELEITQVGEAAQGAVTTDGTSVTYTPDAGYTGTDGFSYTISDGNLGTASANVVITINAENEPPPAASAGYALAFDGVSDYVRLSYTQQILGSGWESTHSVTLWVKPTASVVPVVNDPAWCDAIFGDRPRWWGISQCIINGYDRIWVWNYDGNYDLIGIPYSRNQWVNIGLVQNNGRLIAYRNGIEVAQTASGPTQQPSMGATPALQLGAVINNASRNWSFQGEIDEVRLWNIGLTGAQIHNDLYRLLSGNEPGLAAYYQMSDGAGSTLTDDSIYSWNGTLQDGLSSSVPPDGPIQWVPSGAFDAQNALGYMAENTPSAAPIILSIDAPSASDREDEERIKLFLPVAKTQ